MERPLRQATPDTGAPSCHMATCFRLLTSEKAAQFPAQVVAFSPASLRALLFNMVQVGKHSAYLSWTRQLVDDMQLLWRAMPLLTELGDHNLHFDAWLAFVAAWPRAWRDIVRKYLSYDSGIDKKAATPQVEDPALRPHACPECGARFSSSKALAQHRRTEHSVKSQFNFYISSGTCPVCGKVYPSRLRCIAHVIDGRQGRGADCAAAIAAGKVPRLDDGKVAELTRGLGVQRVQQATRSRLLKTHAVNCEQFHGLNVQSMPQVPLEPDLKITPNSVDGPFQPFQMVCAKARAKPDN